VEEPKGGGWPSQLMEKFGDVFKKEAIDGQNFKN